MSKKRTEKSAAPEIGILHFLIHVSDSAFKFATKALWPACTAFSFFCLAWIVHSATQNLAGKQTDATINADVSLKWGLDRIVAYLVGAGGAGYGVYQRRKRMDNAAVLRAQAEKAEKILDDKRETSGLLPGGHMPEE